VSTQPDTRSFVIERLAKVYLTRHDTGVMTDKQAYGWLYVETVEKDPDAPYFTARDALAHWVNEQGPNPRDDMLGMYRVVERHGDYLTGYEYELRRGDVVIESVRQQATAAA
jgi:hypothetical protein